MEEEKTDMFVWCANATHNAVTAQPFITIIHCMPPSTHHTFTQMKKQEKTYQVKTGNLKKKKESRGASFSFWHSGHCTVFDKLNRHLAHSKALLEQKSWTVLNTAFSSKTQRALFLSALLFPVMTRLDRR